MNTLVLNGTWSVRQMPMECTGEDGLEQAVAGRDGWIAAQVPGEVHLDLMRAGQMPDPSVGANMPECRWPETKSWWFRTQVNADEALSNRERILLIFDGLDLYAQVFLNSRLVGESANAFVPCIFDIKGFLRAGSNDLVVRLTAGSELAEDDTPPGQGQPERKPSAAATGAIPNPLKEPDIYAHRIWAGRKWLRKPQFEYGWDWVDALPNIGIWRGVRIEGRSHAVLDDLRLDTMLHGESVFVEMEAVVENLHPWSERACTLAIELRPPDGSTPIVRSYPLAAQPGRSPVRDFIEIPNPQLWWPNGMGGQPLYEVRATVTTPDGIVCDERTFAIGLRTVDIDRAPLPEGSRFCIRVNGQEVFCRGGNLGPHDAILARISDEKYRTLVADARDANMNMLRINGCSIYEAPAFYDACDRAGILIWQDFMLTCTTYPDDDEHFHAAVRDESAAVVRLLRHHPCIALWSGNNECTWGFEGWWNADKTKPLDLGGQRLYNRTLPDLCRKLDPRRPYWPSSPCGGELPNGETEGDCHWWHPFWMNAEMDRRIRHEVFDECRSRFVSEYGAIGPCHIESVQEYLPPEEMNPDSLGWRMHTNTFEAHTVNAGIRLHYADPEGLPLADYILYGQMLQATLHGHAMEALRFRKHDTADDCAGALIWAYSDCWGETGWSLVDYYLRRKASYYAVRRACAPVKVIVRRRGERLVTRVVNDTLAEWRGAVEHGWWRADGAERDTKTVDMTAPENGMVEVGSASIPAAFDHDPRQWLYAAVLRDAGATSRDQSILTLVPHRELTRPKPMFEAVPTGDGHLVFLSATYCHGVHVEDHGREALSDNWFDLLPGVPVIVRVAPGNQVGDIRVV